jgi:hypothetical protein
MAITSDKLLNRTTKNIDQKIISSGGPSNVVLTKKSVKDIASINLLIQRKDKRVEREEKNKKKS